MSNLLSKVVDGTAKLPAPLRKRALTWIMSNAVPYVGTSGLEIEELTPSRAVVRVRNVRRTQNHIGGVHAAAMTLVAETASGFVVGVNVPDDRVPVVKELRVEFKKRAKGSLCATAVLTDAQREAMREEPKGEVAVEVHVVDESGGEPILATMIWAWVPKRRD